MIRILLDNLKNYITYSPHGCHPDSGATKVVLDSIKKDLEHLSKKDDEFLDGPDGHIDYYSPHVESQLKNKEDLLKKHIGDLVALQAILICINEKKVKIRELTEKGTDTASLKKIEENLSILMTEKNIDTLLQRKDVQRVIEQLNQINLNRKELKELSGKPDAVEIKNRLEPTVKAFDDNDPLQKRINILELALSKHLKLKEKIPQGIIGIKRALNLQSYMSSKDLKFSTSDDVNSKINTMLDDLRTLMSSSIKGYTDLAKLGGDKDVFLHQTTAFYWENLYLYRKSLQAINKYIEENASTLTPQGQLVAECTQNDLGKINKEKGLQKALERVKEADEKTVSRTDSYKKTETRMEMRFYKDDADKVLKELQGNHPDSPLFFLPSNSNFYNIDHPQGTDLAGTLGNCYGETQMFLKRVNQKNPTLNNICPQTDLMNFQLNQTKNAGSLNECVGEFKANRYGLIRLLSSPQTMEIEELKNLINDKPTYALFNKEIYYIDSKFDVTKLSTLTSYQLKNLERKDGASDTPPVFPKQPNQLHIANTNNVMELEQLTGRSQEKSRVTWDEIKDILTGPVKSEKHGDICTIKLAGAVAYNEDTSPAEFAHEIGFIKLKNPDPYQYIVYDYALGAIGISNDEQLKTYFEYIFKHYYPFPDCTVKKIDEVSDDCQALFSETHGIQPLNKEGIGHQCERHFWNKSRLLLLVKYSEGHLDDEVKMTLEKIPLLHSDKAKDEVYEALFENKKISLIGLLETSIKCANEGNIEPLKKILNHPQFLTENISEKISVKMKDELIEEIAQWILNGEIPQQIQKNVLGHSLDVPLVSATSIHAPIAPDEDRWIAALIAELTSHPDSPVPDADVTDTESLSTNDSQALDDESPGLDDESPDLDDESPALDDESPALDDESPDLDDESPDLDDESPALDDESPDLDDESPALDDESPDLDDESPALDDEYDSFRTIGGEYSCFYDAPVSEDRSIAAILADFQRFHLAEPVTPNQEIDVSVKERLQKIIADHKSLLTKQQEPTDTHKKYI